MSKFDAEKEWCLTEFIFSVYMCRFPKQDPVRGEIKRSMNQEIKIQKKCFFFFHAHSIS